MASGSIPEIRKSRARRVIGNNEQIFGVIGGEEVVDRWSRSVTSGGPIQLVPVTRDPIELFEASAGTFRSVLVNVRPEHHDHPTPCKPLDVRGLVSRAIGHQNWVGAAVEGRSEPPSYPDIEPDRWLAALDESTTSIVDELGRDGVMERPVTLAAGLVFSGSHVALLAARNIFQFGWDLAVGTGQSPDLAPDVAAELLEISRTRLVPQRGPDGFFGPEFVPPAGSPIATVLAGCLGREV